MMKPPLLVLLLGTAVLGGCHAKFKKEAPNLGAVRTQVIITGGPYVQLGMVDNATGNTAADVLATGVNLYQGVKGLEVSSRIQEAVDVDKVNYAFQEGIAETLRQGPPFAYTDDPNAPVLQLELESYGLYVPYLGAPGEFTYDMRVRIYKQDGDRVYKSRVDCSTGAGAPEDVAVVLGTVNNVKQIKEMTDEQIQQSFDAIAKWCGAQLVAKMRKHAG